jgi:hypothetical protein
VIGAAVGISASSASHATFQGGNNSAGTRLVTLSRYRNKKMSSKSSSRHNNDSNTAATHREQISFRRDVLHTGSLHVSGHTCCSSKFSIAFDGY